MILSEESQKLLAELRNSHKWCCIDISSDYCWVWYVSLRRGFPKNEDHDVSVMTGAYEDLNDAVKNAYEQAMEFLEYERLEEENSGQNEG